MSILDQLAQAIQTVEGYYPPGTIVGGTSFPTGSVAYRNNNPGNLNYVGQAGSTGADANGYAIFPDYATGYAALVNQIQIDASKGMTLQQLIYSWAPPTGDPRGTNNTTAYLQSVSDATGLAPSASVQAAIAGQTSTAPGNVDSADITDTTDTSSTDGSGTSTNSMFSLADLTGAFSSFSGDVGTAVSTGDVSGMTSTDWMVLAGFGVVAWFVFKR
jgi:hypothetical protein